MSSPLFRPEWFKVVNDLSGRCVFCGKVASLAFGFYQSDDKPYEGCCHACHSRRVWNEEMSESFRLKKDPSA